MTVFMNLSITRIDEQCYRLVINYHNRATVLDFDSFEGAVNWIHRGSM